MDDALLWHRSGESGESGQRRALLLNGKSKEAVPLSLPTPECTSRHARDPRNIANVLSRFLWSSIQTK